MAVKAKGNGIRFATGDEVFEKDSNGKSKVRDGISIRHTMEKEYTDKNGNSGVQKTYVVGNIPKKST